MKFGKVEKNVLRHNPAVLQNLDEQKKMSEDKNGTRLSDTSDNLLMISFWPFF